MGDLRGFPRGVDDLRDDEFDAFDALDAVEGRDPVDTRDDQERVLPTEALSRLPAPPRGLPLVVVLPREVEPFFGPVLTKDIFFNIFGRTASNAR